MTSAKPLTPPNNINAEALEAIKELARIAKFAPDVMSADIDYMADRIKTALTRETIAPDSDPSSQSYDATEAQQALDKLIADDLRSDSDWKPVQSLAAIDDRMCFPVEALLSGQNLDECKEYIRRDLVENAIQAALSGGGNKLSASEVEGFIDQRLEAIKATIDRYEDAGNTEAAASERCAWHEVKHIKDHLAVRRACPAKLEGRSGVDEQRGMNLQDFACRISDTVWGGELGWDRENGLQILADEVKKRFKAHPEPKIEGLESFIFEWPGITPEIYNTVIPAIRDYFKAARATYERAKKGKE